MPPSETRSNASVLNVSSRHRPSERDFEYGCERGSKGLNIKITQAEELEVQVIFLADICISKPDACMVVSTSKMKIK
jgi:hypothetical protein